MSTVVLHFVKVEYGFNVIRSSGGGFHYLANDLDQPAHNLTRQFHGPLYAFSGYRF